MRLIDADELKEQFCEENEDIPNGYNDDLDDYFGSGFSARKAGALIDSAKTVDAVPVVRCKDCIFFTQFHMPYTGRAVQTCSVGIGIPGEVNDDDFCSRAEKKEDSDGN